MATSKIFTLREAISLVKDGDQIALGGFVLKRHPCAMVYEIIRQRKKDLVLLGWNNGFDFDILIGAGCTHEVHTAYVGFGAAGLAPNFRRAAQEGKIRIVDETESTAQDRFRASSMGLTFFPSKTPLGSDMNKNTEFATEITCPFTGERYIALQAWKPDVSLIHAHSADKHGNIRLDERRFPDTDWDIIISQAAKKVIVSVEEIIDERYSYDDPDRTVLPGKFVDAVVELPYGAHPCSCDTRYETDYEFIEMYRKKCDDSESFSGFLREYVIGVNDHVEYIERVGLRRLLKIRRPEGVIFDQ